jgi:GntR family transcriptional regulator, sialic acid-inducible nan operon repressor
MISMPVSPDSRPIARRKLYQDVMDRLLDMIEQRRLRPGDPLPSERELMDLYGVGRPAIREAIHNLSRVGIITVTHGGRTRIAEPSVRQAVEQMSLIARHVLTNSPASLEHLKDARLVYEKEMARLAAIRHTSAAIGELRARIAAQAAALDSAEAFMRCDGEFHREIARISGNPIFVAVSEALFGWLSHFHLSLVRAPGLEQLTLSEHTRIADAIEAGDPDDAALAMQEHLTRANNLYRQLDSA